MLVCLSEDSGYHPSKSCRLCKLKLKNLLSDKLQCEESGKCIYTKTNIPPKITENTELAFDVFEDAVVYSGFVDGFSGIPKINELKMAIDLRNEILSKEEYEMMLDKVKYIYQVRVESVQENKPKGTDN